ncbi:CaiB/BaiF CoA transferase family protein [Streptomyces sp. NPDC088747]|uniref:CaiB/BaiF CoA transferase family protein n=1 Tax=Streptomyces sp. NPDC088747 TaxID=3365886 RepID=UPI0037F9E4AF
MSGGPLSGLRVVELGGIGPVPFCGMMLSDLGADVVRIHRPSELGARPNPVLARGRRSLVVDLKRPGGAALVRRLIARSDAVVEGFRPGTAERLGFDPEDLLRTQPRLVIGRMTGYGQSGPAAHLGGHDINYLAASGVLGALGTADSPPLPPLNLLGDFGGGGMLLAVGVLAALLQARADGVGQVVDAAMVDGAALLMAMVHGQIAHGHWPAARGTSMFSGVRPYYTTYTCADGRHVAVGASEPHFFRALVEGLGLGEAIEVARQTDPSTWDGQRRHFAAAFASRSRDEWARRFTGVDACVTPVLTPEEAPYDEHLAARATFLTDEDGVVQPAPAPRFGARPAGVPASAPVTGEHTDAILAELGLSAGETATLRDEKVVF